jgi:hypothetical protein
MAVKKVYVDLDGRFVNTLLNWRITNLTTVQRNQLATQLGAANIGLPVFDTTANSLFVWGGSTWLPVGAGTGVLSFNTRIGAVTLESTDVIDALGFTPISGPAGNNGDVQFNNGGDFAGTDQFVWSVANNNLLVGSNIDNNTARIQVIDGTGQNQLALHFDDSNFAEFIVDDAGDLLIASTGELSLGAQSVLCNSSFYIAATAFLSWGTPSSFTSAITSFVDGNISIFDSALTDFGLLQFGGLTASYPALGRNGTNLEVKLSDDSAYSNLALSKLLMQSSVLGAPVNGTLETDYTNLYFTLGGVRQQVNFGTFELELSTTGTTGAATYIGTQLNIPIYQGQITLTTTGTTGVATLIGNDLNIPNYTAPSGYTLPPATYSSLGGVIVGSNLWVNSSGLLNLQGSGVTSALGYTPYNATNPAGYITGITALMIDNALGYTPLDPSGISAQYFAGNGQLFTFPTIPTPGGSNTDIQYNNNGAFGGTNAFTWSGSLFYVSGNTQITSLGSTGTTMVVASSTGLLSTQPLPTSTLPGGSNTDIQFNNAGSFAGSNNLTWNGSLLFVSGNTQIGSLASTGTTMVVATATGLLQTQAIPTNAISSVSNIDGTLTISPTTGNVIASLNLGHTNTWTGVQTFSNRTIFGASTAAHSSTNFIAGVAPTTPIPGDQWFDGSNNFFFYSSGSTTTLGIAAGAENFAVQAQAAVGMNYGNTNSGGGFNHTFYVGGTLSGTAAARLNASSGYLNMATQIGGNTAPSSTWLSIVASSAARSQINLVSGATPTAPNNGDMWFDGSYVNLFSSGATVLRSNLGSTVSATLGAIVLKDTTPATSAQTQYSPGIIFSGQSWSTQAGTGSENVQGMIFLQPLQGTTPATVASNLVLSFLINGTWSSPFAFSSAASNWTFGAAGLTINPVGGAGISLTSLPAQAGHFNYPTPSFTFEQVGALTTAGFGTTFINGSGASTNTTGNANQYQFVQSFSPTSGSGTFSLVSLQPTINQTGGASGITAALSISPTLTSAANFYAIQVLGGKIGSAASTVNIASLNIPTGVAPTSPVEGDMWKTGTHLFIYLNGATVQIV